MLPNHVRVLHATKLGSYIRGSYIRVSHATKSRQGLTCYQIRVLHQGLTSGSYLLPNHGRVFHATTLTCALQVCPCTSRQGLTCYQIRVSHATKSRQGLTCYQIRVLHQRVLPATKSRQGLPCYHSDLCLTGVPLHITSGSYMLHRVGQNRIPIHTIYDRVYDDFSAATIPCCYSLLKIPYIHRVCPCVW